MSAAEPEDVVLEFTEVTKVFGNEAAATVALERCSFKMNRGAYVGITGRSGSGKSSLLNLMGLLDIPTTGTVRLAGQSVGQASDAQRSNLRGRTIGFVLQDARMVADRTLLENVEIGLMYAVAIPRRQRRAAAREALAKLGLGHRADYDASAVSGGERQRAAIARAIAKRPDILLADEPTGNLDRESSDVVLAAFDALAEGNCSIAIVTHDPEVASHCAAKWTMVDGRMST